MKGIKFVIRLFIVVILCGLAAGIYAIKIEPNISVVKEHSLGAEAGEQLKVVQISDVQISEGYTEKEFAKLVKKINKLQPDLFLFTGDLYENYAQYGPEEEIIQALSDIEATYGKFAVWGNRDYGGGGVRRYEDILSQAGVQLLENSGTSIATESGATIFLAGLDDYLLGNQEIYPIMNQMGGEDAYHILMTHEPDTADTYADAGFQLILSGHSHGGQVRVPFMKGITTSMAEKYTQGFYTLGSEGTTKLYVNQGIGTSRYPVRFGVPPEITVFDIGL